MNLMNEYTKMLSNYTAQLREIQTRIGKHILSANKSSELDTLAQKAKLITDNIARLCYPVTTDEKYSASINNPIHIYMTKESPEAINASVSPSRNMFGNAHCLVAIDNPKLLVFDTQFAGNQKDTDYIESHLIHNPKIHQDRLYTFIRNNNQRSITLTNPVIICSMINDVIKATNCIINIEHKYISDPIYNVQ